MRRFLRVEHVVPVTAVSIVLAVLLTVNELPCSPVVPCGPEPALWVAFGAVLAPGVMVYLHRRAAAWAAGAAAVVWAVLAPGPAGWALPPWLLVLVTVLIAGRRPFPLSVAVASHRRFPLSMAVARRRPSPLCVAVARRRPPAPVGLPGVGAPVLALGAAVLLAALAAGGLVFWRQAAADRQQAAARVVTGVVEGQPDDGTVRVVVPGGAAVVVDVLDAAAYPAGTEVEMLVDDRGLAQLRAEPYDLTPALTIVLIGVGAGLALLARAAQRRRDLRLLFTGPQPVRDVRVVDQLGYVHVLVPAADGRTALEFGINTADAYSTVGGRDGVTETDPAVLYGEPRRGGWCAVEVAGRLHVPVEPVGDTSVVPYDAGHGLPREVSDDEEQLVDPEALTDADRTAAPGRPREHRIAPARAWFTTVVIGLGAALGATEGLRLAGSAGWPAAAMVAAAGAAGYEFGWRHQLRARLRWHVGGVAAVGFRSVVREPWTVDSAVVHDDEGTVLLTVGESVLAVPAPQPWPSWVGQRSPEQLVAGLRDARIKAFAGGPLPAVPEIVVPARPVALYAAWALTVAAALALVG